MKLVSRLKTLKTHGKQVPALIVLHHTVGPTIRGAEDTLKYRGLGYHYMIDKEGVVYKYSDPDAIMYHAMGHNRGTVSISFTGGGKFGPMTEAQLHACVELINEEIKPKAPSLKAITGHKHLSPGRKIDPRFEGEPAGGVDLAVDKEAMEELAKEVKLEFITKFRK